MLARKLTILSPATHADAAAPEASAGAPNSTTQPLQSFTPSPPCTKCGASDVRRSHSRGPLDAVARALGYKPYRCRWCRTRYFAPA